MGVRAQASWGDDDEIPGAWSCWIRTAPRLRATVLLNDAHPPAVTLNALYRGTPAERDIRAWIDRVIRADVPGLHADTRERRHLTAYP